MRKIIVMLTIVAICTIGLVLTSPANTNNKEVSNSPAQQIQQLTGINGAETPQLIPDDIAYEFFLRSLVANPEEGEIARSRVRSFAAQVSEDNSDIYTILLAAQDFERQVSVLDKQAQDIKDKSWPEPSQAVMDRLADLQRQKEAVVMAAVSSLSTKLDENDAKKVVVQKAAKDAAKAERTADKVSRHVQEKVKRSISSSTPPLPTGHQHGFNTPLGTFLGLASFTPAAQRMGEGYTYSNVSYYLESENILGYGATSERYTSYGHTYQITARLYLEDGREVSTTAPYAGGYASPYLQSQTLNLTLYDPSTLIPYDRFARVETRGQLRCPYAVGSVFVMAATLATIAVPPTVKFTKVSTSWDTKPFSSPISGFASATLSHPVAEPICTGSAFPATVTFVLPYGTTDVYGDPRSYATTADDGQYRVNGWDLGDNRRGPMIVRLARINPGNSNKPINIAISGYSSSAGGAAFTGYAKVNINCN